MFSFKDLIMLHWSLTVSRAAPCKITEYSQNPEYLVNLKLELSAL